MKRVSASFRDPSGYVYRDGEKILRTITDGYREHWQKAIDSDFLARLTAAGDAVAFAETTPLPGSWKTLTVEKIPFVSHPYEWCFSQLRDAGLLTLRLLNQALDHNLVLKDASAFNVQFVGSRPVFIDLLSFETRQRNRPWQAYRQFCMHFLAPLALQAMVDLRCGAMAKLWVDGIPLDLAAKMLPWTARLRFGLLLHLILHAGMEKKHGDARRSAAKAKAVKIEDGQLKKIATHLASTIEGLRLPRIKTEWGDYYTDTNYTQAGIAFKREFTAKTAEDCHKHALAVDLGANTGQYSAILATRFDSVVAADIDPLAVERHYLALKKGGAGNILPLVLDLGNPSPALGWDCAERDSFAERCQADMVAALALIHHISIGMGVPLGLSADFFARLVLPGGTLLLEFIPKEDSQIQRMLAAREDVFADYSLEAMRAAFGGFFEEIRRESVPESLRTLHVFRRR